MAGGGEQLEGDGLDGGFTEARAGLAVQARCVVAFEDGALVGQVGVVDLDLEQEAVELRLGERVGAFELDGVLGGEDGEVVVEGVALAVGGDLAFFHGLEQRGLGARGHAVDLVGEQELGEDGALVEAEVARFWGEDAGAEDVGGHHVGRALDAAEVEAEEAGEGLDGEGLGDAGDAFEQGVAAAEHGHEGLGDGLVLPGDDAADLVLAAGEEFGGGGLFAHGGSFGGASRELRVVSRK